jgi:arylsulfatase A-like enzyme
MKPKDIIFLVLDTQRADRLSCYGYPFDTSPNLDAFGREATIFEQAVSPAQWTVPSHASMFTGLYPSEHSMWQFNSKLPDRIPTLAERLRDVGYFAAAFSNNPLIGAVENGLQRGFDKIINYNYSGFGLWSSHLSDTESSSFFKKRLRILRSVMARLLGYGVGASRSWVFKIADPLIAGILTLQGETKGQNTAASLEAAVDLIRHRDQIAPGQPIFTFINLMGVHVPYDPQRWAVKKFLSQNEEGRYSLLHRANATGLNPANWIDASLSTSDDKAVLSGIYDAEVATQDAYLGHFLNQLHDIGALNHTLLIVVADHGEQLGEKNLISHVFDAYQPLVHVPLIIRDPLNRLPRGERVTEFTSTRRLFHYVLDFANIATPEEKKLSLMSEDLILTPLDCECVMVESLPPTSFVQRVEKYNPGLVHLKGYDQPIRAIYKDTYKLLTRVDRPLGLYDIWEDPDEVKDLKLDMQNYVNDLISEKIKMLLFNQNATKSSVFDIDDARIADQLRRLGYME